MSERRGGCQWESTSSFFVPCSLYSEHSEPVYRCAPHGGACAPRVPRAAPGRRVACSAQLRIILPFVRSQTLGQPRGGAHAGRRAAGDACPQPGAWSGGGPEGAAVQGKLRVPRWPAAPPHPCCPFSSVSRACHTPRRCTLRRVFQALSAAQSTRRPTKKRPPCRDPPWTAASRHKPPRASAAARGRATQG